MGDKKKTIYRLKDIDTQFVSLVPSGANRQTQFLVVKASQCPACGHAMKGDGELTCEKCGKAFANKPEDKASKQESEEQKSARPSVDIEWIRAQKSCVEKRIDDFDIGSLAPAMFAAQGASERSVGNTGGAQPGDSQSQETEQLKKQLEEIEKERDEMRGEARRAKSDLQAAESRLAALQSTVAGTSTIPNTPSDKRGNVEKRRIVWTGDLAEQARHYK